MKNFNLKVYTEDNADELSPKQLKTLQSSLNRLDETYEIEKVELEETPIISFKTDVKNINFIPFLCFRAKSIRQTFYFYFIRSIIPGSSRTEPRDAIEIWGLKILEEDFGEILIREENLSDRITDLIYDFDFDFEEDRKFSKTFCVQTTDREKARSFLNSFRRETLLKFPEKDFYLEIRGPILTFGQTKDLSLTGAMNITKLLEVL